MALGTGQSTTTTASNFIGDLWSDEIAVRYKKRLVLGNLVANMDVPGGYGDVIHVPTSTRGSAAQYFSTQGQEVSFTAPTTNEFTITVNQWWVHGKQIPDLVDKQALPSYRRFIINDMSYSLALAVDDYLFDTVAQLLRGASARAGAVIGGDGSTVWNPAANTNTGNGTSLTDDGIRRVMQTLDDLDVPGTGRYWVVPPIEKRKLLGISRFTEQAFVGEGGGDSSIRNGYVGNLYGAPVYVSSNVTQFNATDATTPYRSVVYAHEDAIILAMQMKPRVQSQYKVEFLSDAVVADVAFGAQVVRTENDATLDRGVLLVVPNT